MLLGYKVYFEKAHIEKAPFWKSLFQKILFKKGFCFENFPLKRLQFKILKTFLSNNQKALLFFLLWSCFPFCPSLLLTCLTGGWGWLVVLGFCFSHFILGLNIKAFGVTYLILLDKFHASATATIWVGAITISCTHGVGNVFFWNTRFPML